MSEVGKKNELLILIAFAVILVVAGVVGYYFISTSNKAKQDKVSETPPIKELTQEEAKEGMIAINNFDSETRAMSKGMFEKAINRKIFLTNGDIQTEFPLHREVIVVCTENNIDELTSIEYKDDAMKLYGPDSIGTIISPNEPIAVVTQELEGVATVHTIAISSESCPE